jgi:hypothetical protein
VLPGIIPLVGLPASALQRWRQMRRVGVGLVELGILDAVLGGLEACLPHLLVKGAVPMSCARMSGSGIATFLHRSFVWPVAKKLQRSLRPVILSEAEHLLQISFIGEILRCAQDDVVAVSCCTFFRRPHKWRT